MNAAALVVILLAVVALVVVLAYFDKPLDEGDAPWLDEPSTDREAHP